MEKEFQDYDAAEDFVKTLYAEDKWAIAARQNGDKYVIQWIERKTYTSYDGNVHQDEVWATEKGELILIQDLSAEHARNIVRMMLRQERQLKERMFQLMGALDQPDEESEDELATIPADVPPNTVFH